MSSTHGTAIIAADAVFMAVAAAAVGLRFYVRKRSAMALAADDWLALVAWFFAAALAITNIIAVPVGHFGLPFASLTNDDTIAFLKFWFTIQFFYIFAVATVKFSVLYFYKRIFSTTKTPLSIWILLGLTIGWLISFFFATLLQVYPIWCNWILCPATADFPLIFVMSSVTDILLDIAILSLPAFFIWRLHMSLAKKIGLISIFGLGLFCIVASIARLVYTVEFLQANRVLGDLATNFDVSRDNTILWSGIEACFSTTCANLPCYAPLFFGSRRSSSLGGETLRSPTHSYSHRHALSSNRSRVARRWFFPSAAIPGRPPPGHGLSKLPSNHSREEAAMAGRNPQPVHLSGEVSDGGIIAVEDTVEVEFSDRRETSPAYLQRSSAAPARPEWDGRIARAM